ncbi:DUF3604 domain-containing protein [Microbulbifer hydrolyticus]|uniref:DUF3604 domain-containing protein n=1 Tax=Microbulbifer hydrolyticus TaxID=48074 RepID=A0A6P1T5Y5_9GAMM|nr:DUF3604 domain-containing protein [Microbulbifer hydrolyticus]MBB5210953.1 hypothetical protein [Microbulbifer hydrolyticus]QHQ38234.1 DUF3604 domain-containing protein [Microbulbifer hydrolyticus]
MKNTFIRTAAALALMGFALPSLHAQDTPAPTEEEIKEAKKIGYSPYPGQDFPNQVLFGETHLHTSYSTDAGMVGCTLTPEDAYRFAMGEEVTSSTGVPARLNRPLDFLVVSDHAENLGLSPAIAVSDPDLLKNAWGKKQHDLVKSGTEGALQAYENWMAKNAARDNPLADMPEMMENYWKKIIEAAEKYNSPGRFTAFIGYEWTSMPDGNNIHRNIIFRDGGDKASQVLPFSQYDSFDPEDLWKWMAAYEKKTGGRLLAIPHNGNLSNGLMFDDQTYTGDPLTEEYAKRRMKWEPIYEITQMKGDGEAHPMFSPDDEFADYETWDRGSFGPQPKTKDMLPKEYAREAWKRGLVYEAKLGANPFKFGVIGSTDSHTALSTAEEDNYFGKVSLLEPSAAPVRFEEVVAGRPAPKGSQSYASQIGAAGIAAVWARENTREAIWDAMARKEVFATTGTRIRVRVFGGFDFSEKDLLRSDFAKNGYDKGVPMGGDLKKSDKAPSFLVRALRDPDGANLDRIQMIKGWADAKGKTHEKVYDLAVSGGRTIGTDGRSKEPVGNTVNVEQATYDNSIGAVALDAYWKDPDFDPAQKAFYYVRVIEIPTPRWTTIDAKVFGVKRPDNVPTTIQERAYTSPIWYTPQ